MIHVVEGEGAGERLDRYLAIHFPQVSRATVMKYLKEGHARLNGRRARPGLFVRPGDKIDLPDWDQSLQRIRKGEAEGLPPISQKSAPRDVAVLFEDEHMVAVSKPPGLVMHPGSGHEREGLDLILREHFGPSTRLVHRIDRDTSGVVVAARGHPESARRLTAAFRDGDNEKLYHALVRGVPDPDRGTIDLPLLDTKAEGARVHVDPHGKRALTQYAIEESFGEFAWLQVAPETGRRHQIRAHLAEIGHPLAVDHVYARRRKLRLSDLRPDLPVSWKNPVLLTRQPLHASRITLRHPATGEEMTLDAPLADDLEKVLEVLRAR
jgi:RluA family pseudouridine synthase